jgi:hypothetical protein
MRITAFVRSAANRYQKIAYFSALTNAVMKGININI